MVLAVVFDGVAGKFGFWTKQKDSRGKQWAYVADATARPIGWVFKEYLVCR